MDEPTLGAPSPGIGVTHKAFAYAVSLRLVLFLMANLNSLHSLLDRNSEWQTGFYVDALDCAVTQPPKILKQLNVFTF